MLANRFLSCDTSVKMSPECVRVRDNTTRYLIDICIYLDGGEYYM